MPPASGFGPPPQWGAQPQPWPPGPPVGQGPPGPYPYGYYPAPAKRPPRKFWFGIGAALLAIGLVLSLGLGIGGFIRIKDKQPQPETIFSSGRSTSVHLDPENRKILFIAGAAQAGGHPVHCIAAGAGGGRVSLKRYDGNLTLNKWNALFTLDTTQAGQYTLSCVGAPSDTFGVGEYVGPGAFIFSIVSVIAGVVVILAGAVTMVVTAVLRSRRSQPPAPPVY